MKCLNCGVDDAITHPVYGVLPCLNCQNVEYAINNLPEFVNLSKKNRIDPQRDKYAKDILQPFDGNKINKDFVKAYPKRATDYYRKEDLKKL